MISSWSATKQERNLTLPLLSVAILTFSLISPRLPGLSSNGYLKKSLYVVASLDTRRILTSTITEIYSPRSKLTHTQIISLPKCLARHTSLPLLSSMLPGTLSRLCQQRHPPPPSPFLRATRLNPPPRRHVALDVVRGGTRSSNMTTMTPTSPLRGGRHQVTVSRVPMADVSASATTSFPTAGLVDANTNTFVPYAGRTTGLEISTLPVSLPNPFEVSILPAALPFHTFDRHLDPPLPDTTRADAAIYNRIVTPYDAHALAIELDQLNITERYPLVVQNILTGFSLGNMPTLTESIIIRNHPSVAKHPKFVAEYIKGEVDAGRMSGPYSLGRVERILQGFIMVSPIIVAESSQGPDKSDKLRFCRNLSKEGRSASGEVVKSVNDSIDSSLFPTAFDSTLLTAHTVSFLSVIFSSPLYIRAFRPFVPSRLSGTSAYSAIYSLQAHQPSWHSISFAFRPLSHLENIISPYCISGC